MSAEVVALVAMVFVLSYTGTRQLALPGSKLALLDRPNARSLHTSPTPRTGGLAILVSLALGLAVERIAAWAGFLGEAPVTVALDHEWYWIMGLTVLLGAISFWDDRVGLPPFVRLGVHGLAATGVVYGAGLVVTTVSFPVLGTLSLGWAAGPLTVLGLMWVINLYNFMDGMDGFAGGMTVVGFGMLSYFAFSSASHVQALVTLLITTAAAGFLRFNWPPARIFMGDVGSVPLGFLAGGLSVMGVHHAVYDLWIPVLIFSPFIVDATVTLIHRLVRGEKVWHAHCEHYYQRLVLAGWGHRRTVVVEYGLMLICGISAVLYWRVNEVWRLAILVVWVGLYFWLARAVAWVERQQHGSARQSQMTA